VVYEGPQRVGWGYGLAARPWSEEATNNVAEYMGVIRALEWLLEEGKRGDVRIRGDSLLVVKQLAGKYAVKAERLRPLYTRAVELLSNFASAKFEWIPRERNREADELSVRAYIEVLRDEEQRARAKPFLADERLKRLLAEMGLNVPPYLSKMGARRLLRRARRGARP
jgi:ribonuclease HI